ncbi:MAG: MFS transporter [Acidobacteriota bacterium]|nr:MFS transporter [Acidobacteriota bacterium]
MKSANNTAETGDSNNSSENFRARFAATFRALKHRNFQLFFSGQFISLIGTWMQNIARSWLVYQLTGSVALLGLVGFAGQFPVFVLSTFGGTIADRYDRRKILVATQTASMILTLVMGVLVLTGTVREWHIFLIAVLSGIVNSLDIPTRQSFVVEMVGKEDLLNAIALNSSMFNGARIIGPAIAGIVVSLVGTGWCFVGDGISYIAVIVGLLLMRIEKKTIVQTAGSTLEKIKEGFVFVRHTQPIRSLLLLLGLVSLMGMPYAVLMPIFADQILHGGVRGLGILMGASGIGALIAALYLASRKNLKGLGTLVAASSGIFGIFLILFSFSNVFWLSAVLLVPVGFSMMLQMAASNTLVQAMVPDALRGRVMAVYSMMFMGMAPIGALLAGSLADRIGAPSTVAFGGVICIIGSIFFGRKLPSFRNEARRIIVSMQMTGGVPATKASYQQPVLTGEDFAKQPR